MWRGSFDLSLFHVPGTAIYLGASTVKIKENHPCPCGVYILEWRKQAGSKIRKIFSMLDNYEMKEREP